VDATNRNTALASAMVEELARCGVRQAAVSPGSRSTPIALALWRAPAIEVTVVLDERSAGFFALGAAQATGIPAVVACTSGSAAANLHPAIVEADEGGVSLIALTADRPPELRGIGAGQTIDQLELFGSSVRWFCDVGTHEADDTGLTHFRAVACRGFALALGEPRPGPVHLNLAFREPLAPVPVEGQVRASSELALRGRGERPLTSVVRAGPALAAAQLDELAERLGASPRGVIVCGRQTDPGLAGAVARLAAATGYPILAEPTSQVRCGHHELDSVVAPYDLIARSRPEALAPQLVLRFGEMPTSKPLRQWLAALPEADQVLVDPAGGWNDPSRLAATILRANAIATAGGLAERATTGGSDWIEAWRAAAGAVEAAVDEELASLVEPSEPGLHRALGGVYADGDVVYTGSSMPIRDQETFLAALPVEARFLANRGTNGIDGLISSAAGAARASGRPTYCVTGDLGLVYDMAGLASARSLTSPLRIVVIDNGGGGIFHFLPQAEALADDEFEALLGTPSGLSIARIAALYGLAHAKVASLEELPQALAADRVIVELGVDRRENVELHRRIATAAEAALGAAL
jgi:2-succinyl-5-enolpyruvyl-6-hydroxy-3-cyclohexene-1-carboxylate synthase